jgi:predicted ATPase/DNA-binding winged helix-turn-helix (wHTH) protein
MNLDLAREARFALGALEVRPPTREVVIAGQSQVLEPRIMQVLAVLAKRRGQVVSRDELTELCWEGRIVGDGAITRCIHAIRRLAEAHGGFSVQTVARVGYRLSEDADERGEFGEEGEAPSVAVRPFADPTETHPNNLPRRQTSLLGRGEELVELAALLAKSDLVTITGAGGVGKTRIAIELCRAQLAGYDDGVWLVELAPVSDPAMAPNAIARALNIEVRTGEDSLTSIVERLRARRCLILLDNCEHLIEAVVGLVEAVLERAPDVKLLATSQDPLAVSAEQVYRLRPLAGSDAAALFVERAQAADARFVIGKANVDAVAAICHRLDGIPLAIEMAAARAPALGCDGLLERLHDRFHVLAGGPRTALPRHRTLLATLDWSHSLLSESCAAVFRRLGVFTGGFTLEAACEVVADEGIEDYEVIDALSSLVAKSLVVADTEDGRTRYRLLETPRSYALEKLAAAHENRSIRRRHAQSMLKFTAPSNEDYFGGMSDEAFAARYFADGDNIDQAIDWAFAAGGDLELGLSIVAATGRILIVRNRYSECIQYLTTAVAQLTPTTPEAVRCDLLVLRATSFLMSNQGMPSGVIDEAIEAARGVGDPIALAGALNAAGYTATFTGRLAEARALADESLAIVSRLPLSRLTGQTHHMAAYVTLVESGEAAANPLFARVVSELRSIGAEGLANWFLLAGTSSQIPQDDSDVAIVGLRDVLARIRPWHMYAGGSTGLAASNLAFNLAMRGRPADIEEAREVAHTFRKVASRGAGGGTVYLYWLAMARIAAASGQPQTAAMLGGYVEALRAAQGNSLARARLELDRLRADLGRLLPEAEVTAAWTEGALISQDEADRLAADEG